jgi:hypothetical protein
MNKTTQPTKTRTALIAFACSVAFALAAPLAFAHPQNDAESPSHDHSSHAVHENGVGPDPDGDTNPATDTRVVSFIADAEAADGDPPYTVITFEPPPGKHGEAIRQDYAAEFGVKFGKGLTWQICTGKRLFYYDTMCTYEAPTSGKFSAGYLNYLNAPLSIKFEKPICVVTMSIYPTGGKEDEPFEFKIQGWNEAGDKLSDATAEFRWTANTVRWRNMAGAYFVDQRAAKITISMRSKDPSQAKDTLRYLIDDLAFVDEGCDAALDDIKERTGIDLRDEVVTDPVP